jgi:hypothetical protein
MHLDEIRELAGQAGFAGDAYNSHTATTINWYWPALVIDGVTCHEVEAKLDFSGHLFIITSIESCDHLKELILVGDWCLNIYMEILSHWSALYADVLRGMVVVGDAAIMGVISGDNFIAIAAKPEKFSRCAVPIKWIYGILLTESCRHFVYSTTERFRLFSKELAELRSQVINGKIVHAEEISVIANQRVEDSRTIRTRLEIATQTIENLLNIIVDPCEMLNATSPI